MSSYPFNILNTSIKSPLNLLVSSSQCLKILFHTLILKNHLSFWLPLFAPFLKYLYLFKYGLHACMQYSNLGLINDL